MDAKIVADLRKTEIIELQNRIAELKEKYESTGTKCHGGHVNNLPLALWDCPMCTTELRAALEKSHKAVVLLNSMILSGEQHSPQSERVVRQALEGESP